MTIKELLKAIKTCKKVYANTHLTEHDMFNIQIVKKDLLWEVEQCDVEKWNNDYFNAFLGEGNNLYIG